MNPLEQRVQELEKQVAALLGKSDRHTIQKLSLYNDGRNMQFGLTTGTKIGTSTLQKIGFWNAAPVIQQSVDGRSINSGTDCVPVLDDMRNKLKTLGILTF